MKTLKALFCLLFLAALVTPSFSQKVTIVDITPNDYTEYFKEADSDVNEVIEGHEVDTLLVSVIEGIFKKNHYYMDEGMIFAIADDLIAEHGEEYSKNFFLNFKTDIPKRVAEFREKIYRDLIKAYRVENIMEDSELAKEVYANPQVYGLTYDAHRVLFFQIEKAVEEVEAPKRTIYNRFEAFKKSLGNAYYSAKNFSKNAADDVTMRVRDRYHHLEDGVTGLLKKIHEHDHLRRENDPESMEERRRERARRQARVEHEDIDQSIPVHHVEPDTITDPHLHPSDVYTKVKHAVPIDNSTEGSGEVKITERVTVERVREHVEDGKVIDIQAERYEAERQTAEL